MYEHVCICMHLNINIYRHITYFMNKIYVNIYIYVCIYLYIYIYYIYIYMHAKGYNLIPGYTRQI